MEVFAPTKPARRKRFAERLHLVDSPAGGVLICDGQSVFTKVASRAIAEGWLAGAHSTLPKPREYSRSSR